jgi:hypothetical protein
VLLVNRASTHARLLRGALVGFCSAATSAAAHGAAGGMVPSGASLVLLLLACSMVGALTGSVPTRRGGGQVAFVVAALLGGQVLGHLVLVASSCDGHSGLAVSPGMLVAHGLGALACALLIGAAEHLYVVCVSVLSWLSVFGVRLSQPAAGASPHWVNPLVLQALLLESGGGTRGPPRIGTVTA